MSVTANPRPAPITKQMIAAALDGHESTQWYRTLPLVYNESADMRGMRGVVDGLPEGELGSKARRSISDLLAENAKRDHTSATYNTFAEIDRLLKLSVSPVMVAEPDSTIYSYLVDSLASSVRHIEQFRPSFEGCSTTLQSSATYLAEAVQSPLAQIGQYANSVMPAPETITSAWKTLTSSATLEVFFPVALMSAFLDSVDELTSSKYASSYKSTARITVALGYLSLLNSDPNSSVISLGSLMMFSQCAQYLQREMGAFLQETSTEVTDEDDSFLTSCKKTIGKAIRTASAQAGLAFISTFANYSLYSFLRGGATPEIELFYKMLFMNVTGRVAQSIGSKVTSLATDASSLSTHYPKVSEFLRLTASYKAYAMGAMSAKVAHEFIEEHGESFFGADDDGEFKCGVKWEQGSDGRYRKVYYGEPGKCYDEKAQWDDDDWAKYYKEKRERREARESERQKRYGENYDYRKTQYPNSRKRLEYTLVGKRERVALTAEQRERLMQTERCAADSYCTDIAYKVLNKRVGDAATAKEVHSFYRGRARFFHPDKCQEAYCEDAFVDLGNAVDVAISSLSSK